MVKKLKTKSAKKGVSVKSKDVTLQNNIKSKTVIGMSKSEYLSSIVNLHINHQVILSEKTAFLVAVSALVLTISLTALFDSSYVLPFLIKIGLILLSLGSAFSIIMCISIEVISPVRKVNSFHPLSLDEFHDEAKLNFYKDLVKTCSTDSLMLRDYSNQILEMKEDIVRKTSKITHAIYCLTWPLFIMTLLICIQVYLALF